MKKFLAGTLSLLLMGTLFGTSASAAVKAGAACSKKGISQSVSGKKFTCTQVGKKLQWKLIPTSKPTQTATTTGNQTPTTSAVKPVVAEGTPCSLLGEKVAEQNPELICLYTAGKNLKYLSNSNATNVSTKTENNSDVNVCKLPDLRSNKGSGGGGTGFPLQGNVIKSNGVVKVAVLGYNFPGSPAVGSPESVFKKYTDLVDARNKYLYEDRIKFEWTYLPEWLMTEKAAEVYAADHSTYGKNGLTSDGVNQILSMDELSNYYFSLAEKKLNLKDYDFFFIVTNPLESKVPQGPFARSATIRTPTATYTGINFYSLGYRVLTSQWQDPRMLALHDIVAHEIAHYQGLVQHAPGNGWGWYISNNPAWEAWLAGWRPDSEFVCFDSSGSWKTAEVSLASLDLDNKGFKAAVIKVSTSKAIVIESRRKGPFITALPDHLAGITAFVVDTSVNPERYDGDVSKEELYYAWFLRNKSNKYPVYQFQNIAMWDENIIGYQGDFFEYAGVKIELTKSGSFDTIRITK